MKSLFLRVFVSFWLAMTVIVVGAVLFTLHALAERAEDAPLQPPRLMREAAAALQAGGRDGLAAWLREHERRDGAVRVFVVDAAGHELLERPLPPRLRHRLDRLPPHDAPAFGDADVPNPPGPPPARWLPPRPVAVLVGDDGERYAFLFAPRRPGPLGPLGLSEARTGTLLLALLVTGLASWLLARSVTRPVGRLTEAVRAIATGRLDTRVATGVGGRRDELGVLAREFDTMTDRVRALLIGRERLLRDVSHELRSPLARLQVALGLARQPGADVAIQLERIECEAGRLEALIAQVLRLSRLDASAGEARREPTDLAALVQAVVHDAGFEAEPRGVAVRCHVPAEAPVVAGDVMLLRSAIENVVRNAIRYTDPARGVDVEVRAHAGGARIVVRDHGPGVPVAELERIFEPFHRVAEDRTRDSGGDGIGLAITARVLRSHGGRAFATLAAGGGLEVVLDLPRAPAP